MRAFRAAQLRMILLSLAVASAMPVKAVDTREVIIDRQAELAISPEHRGHVLASPNRDFTLPYTTGASNWWVFAQPRAQAVWVDESYLHDPRNIEVRRTYFDFDVDSPIDASAVIALLKSIKDIPVSYLLVGHADEVGTNAYNMRLSVSRANNMRELLVEAGLDRKSIKAIGKGNHVLASLRNQALNRRVEIIVRGSDELRAEVKKVFAAQTAQARRAKMEQDALKRATNARFEPSQRPVPGFSTSVPISPTRRNSSADSQKKSLNATQKAILPPVRESQMGSNNPFFDGKE